MDATIVIFALLLLAVVTLFKGVRQVPQGSKWVVQRLGKYHKSLSPGLNFIVPYVDSVAYKVTTKDIVLDIPSQEVITLDNVVIVANAVAYINILSPEKAVYGVEDYQLAIRTLVQTSLRSIVGELALDQALSSRDQIKAKLKAAISDDIADWGITLKTVEIQDINPSATMQKAWRNRRRRSVCAALRSPAPRAIKPPPSCRPTAVSRPRAATPKPRLSSPRVLAKPLKRSPGPSLRTSCR